MLLFYQSLEASLVLLALGKMVIFQYLLAKESVLFLVGIYKSLRRRNTREGLSPPEDAKRALSEELINT